MSIKGNALNVVKGWAVASLFRAARENRQMKKFLKNGGLILISLMVAHPVLAAGTDLLASQQSTVSSTFGSRSPLILSSMGITPSSAGSWNQVFFGR